MNLKPLPASKVEVHVHDFEANEWPQPMRVKRGSAAQFIKSFIRRVRRWIEFRLSPKQYSGESE